MALSVLVGTGVQLIAMAVITMSAPPLLAVTRCHTLSHAVTRCHTLSHMECAHAPR